MTAPLQTESDLAEQALRLRSLGIDSRPEFNACASCELPRSCKGVRHCAKVARPTENNVPNNAREAA